MHACTHARSHHLHHCLCRRDICGGVASLPPTLYITGRKRIIGARRACEQTSVFQLLGEIRERKHQHTMIHAHHHDQSVSTQVIVVLNFKI